MLARHEQDETVLAQLHRMDARIGGHLRHNRDIGGVLDQVLEHGGRIVDLEREGEAFMPAFQRRQDRHDVIGAVGAHPQMPARQRAAAGEESLRLLFRGEQPRGDRMQRLPGRRQLHAAPASRSNRPTP